jgi:arsenate reductase
MEKDILKFIHKLSVDSIPPQRKQMLTQFSKTLQNELQDGVALQFICTHNSRRSHFGQVWAQTMAEYFGLRGKVITYSGGTETTALYPSVIQALKSIGFKVETKCSEDKNAIYLIKYHSSAPPIIGFSKKYDDFFNPQSDFIAVMTCSQADEDCPFIPGAKSRFSLGYEDPKVFDNTEKELSKYLERSEQIATEMYYLFSKLRKY